MKTITLSLLLCCSISLSAQECTPDWQFYRAVNLDYNGSVYDRPYQVRLPLKTGALIADGKLRADLADLRVFNSACEPLPFVALAGPAADSTTIWVKLAGTNLNANALQLYYGKATAPSVMNGDSVFTFFDDFSGDVIDTSKWETIGEFSRFDVADGIATYASTSSINGGRFKFARTKASFNDENGQVFQFRGKADNTNGFGFSSSLEPLERHLFRIGGALGPDTLNQIANMADTLNNGFATINNYPWLAFPHSTLNTFEITTQLSDNKLELKKFANLDTGDENTTSQVLDNYSFPRSHFIMSTFSATNIIELDYLFVRATDMGDFAGMPTLVVLGEEAEAIPNSLTPLLADSEVQVFPNPTSGIVRLKVPTGLAFQLEITDALGRRHAPNGLAGSLRTNTEIDLSGLPRGVYALRLLRAGDGRWLQTRKLVLE